MSSRVTTLAAALTLIGSPTLAAADSLWDNFQVHGFAAQAAIQTTDNRWFGDSTNTSFGFTEIGLNASLRFNPRLLVSGQVLVRRAGKMYDGTPQLDYALADITAVATPEQRFGIRLGRIKNTLGLYNETRDTPFTHPGIFLPQTVYFDRVRNLLLSNDGAMLYAERYGDFGSISATLGAGRALIDENVEWGFLFNDFQGDMKTRGISWVGSLWYASQGERLKLGLSGARTKMDFDPKGDPALTLGRGHTDVDYWILSFQYNAEDWTISAEYAREPIVWEGYDRPIQPDRKASGEGWYIQGTYRVRPTVELMLRWEEGVADRYDRNGRMARRMSGGLFPDHMFFDNILTAGVRWDINRHWMLRAEFQHHKGSGSLPARENRIPFERVKNWNLFAVQAAFRF